MKDLLFDARIIAARPVGYKVNTEFTDKVMKSIMSPEILSSQIRRMSVIKKETLFMKLRHLPKLAIVAIALGTLLLLSGTAYAAYQLLWQKPEVQVSKPTTSVSGRHEVAISLAQCGDANLGSRYELKKSATITADEVPMVVKAQCELGVINAWAQTAYPSDDLRARPITNREYDSVHISTSMATHIKSREGSSITFMGLTKYNQTDTTLQPASSVRYIADGKEVTAGAITENDPIVYITSDKSHMIPSSDCTDQQCSATGTMPTRTLLAVVKLSLPFESYDQYAWQSLAERQTCAGNPEDSCLTGNTGSIDLYQGGATITVNRTVMKEIQGVITSINGKTVTIRSSSGASFAVTTPTDVVNAYNTNKASRYYNGQTVKIGSSLVARYVETESEHSKNLAANSLISLQLQIEIVGKNDPVKSY